MITAANYVRQSIDLHIFFSRIMKEHSFFLEVSFTPRDSKYTHQADDFRKEFDKLLEDVVSISSGVVTPSVLQSGEIVTPYTAKAEMASAYYTGIKIPIDITHAEHGLMGDDRMANNKTLERRVSLINQRAIELISALIRFKAEIIKNVLSCKMFTTSYPLMVDHIMREAHLYLQMVQKLESKEEIETNAAEQEFFWNRIMAEHSKFIRGLLDPTENELFNIANAFGNEFDELTMEAKAAMDMTLPIEQVTDETLNATKRIRDFKEQGTQGLLNCKIKSIIIPLLGDHVLREANHYLRLLKTFDKAY